MFEVGWKHLLGKFGRVADDNGIAFIIPSDDIGILTFLRSFEIGREGCVYLENTISVTDKGRDRVFGKLFSFLLIFGFIIGVHKLWN